MLSLLFSAHEGELLLSDTDPVAGGCVLGEWPDGLTAGSELGSVSVSCCEAVADRKAQQEIRNCGLLQAWFWQLLYEYC